VLLGIRGVSGTLIWQYMGLKECCGRKVVGTFDSLGSLRAQ